jgi:CRISP-associated protein Cas1
VTTDQRSVVAAKKALRLSPEDISDGLKAIQGTYSRDPIDPSICVADGHGISVKVERSHLRVEDGLGPDRRVRRYARPTRTLRRLLILGDGYVTLQALRFCRAVGVSVIVLDDDGVSLTSSTPGQDDARLRRAQALALGTETGLGIVRDLLKAKITGHARNARQTLGSEDTARALDMLTTRLEGISSLEDARAIEAQAAQVYFAAWPTRDVLRFVTNDLRRISPHWRRFDGRKSPIRGTVSNQRAATPLNAIINYCSRLAEIEATLAIVAVGLDEGMGLLHSDYPGRPSLSLDLLEVLRPEVDAYVFRLTSERTFRKADFHEKTDGHVRVLAPLSHELAEAVMPMCARAVAPHAEAVAHALLDTVPGKTTKRRPLTSKGRGAKGGLIVSAVRTPLPPSVCRTCGTKLERADYQYCENCRSRVREDAAHKGRQAHQRAHSARLAEGLSDPNHTPKAKALRGAAIGRRDAEALAWDAAHPDVNVKPEDFGPIREGLAMVRSSHVIKVTGLSEAHTAAIKNGRLVPHLRWWPILAELSGVDCPFDDTPNGLTLSWWQEVVGPALSQVTTTAVRQATGLSKSQAVKVRRGLHVPNPKHWRTLAALAGVPLPSDAEVHDLGAEAIRREKVTYDAQVIAAHEAEAKAASEARPVEPISFHKRARA